MDKFYATFLGGLYLEFLLWLDGTREDKKYLTPKQMAQIVRESNKLAEGTLVMKTRVNALLNSKTKEEYELRLSEIQDLLPLSEYQDSNSPRAIYVNFLKSIGDTAKIVDVENATDRAKMIEKKIEAVYELQDYNAKRQLAKTIQKHIQEGNQEEANRLRQEFKRKYGR